MTDPVRRPNIVLVTVDSLRADHVYSDIAGTQTLDDLADAGCTYELAFAQGPFTTFSMPSLFTSRYPSGLGYVEFSESTVGGYIDDEPTLPELLRNLGYTTAGFHSNPLLSNLFGFDRGFDTFDARLPLSNTDWLPGRAKILAEKLLRLARKHAYLPAEALTARAVDWLERHANDRPFFLWVHYMDVHGPYQAKSGNAYLNKFRGERLWRRASKHPERLSDDERQKLRQLYRIEVEYTDRWIGELLDDLRYRGLFEETVTVITADHGEFLGRDGRYSHPHVLHDELTHVPLIVRDPDGETGTVENIVELLDITPTLIERAGGDLPDSFAGVPLPPVHEQDDGTIAISEADLVPAYNGSVRTTDYRYIRNDVEATEEIFKHPGDPVQRTDVSETEPEKLAGMKTLLDAHLEAPDRAAGPNRDVERQRIDDAGVETRLRDLGYLQ